MFNLKEKINKSIERFIEHSSFRSKKECGDLGEFIINMFLSSYSYFTNDKLKEALLTEFFTRQIYWIEKNSFVNLSRSSSGDEMLKTAFEASKTANRLLVFNIEMARFFITDAESKTKILDERLGFLPDHVINSFQNRVVQIKNIANYQVLMSAIGFSAKINSSQKMADFLLRCKNLSIKQGYSR